MKRIIMLFLCFLLITAGISSSLQAADVVLKKGDNAPSYILLNLNEKFSKSKELFGKKIVLLDFWATYCKPCKQEMPELIRMMDEFKDKDVTVVCISLDKEGVSIVKKYLQENKFTIPADQVLLDIYKMAAGNYGVTKLPSLFIVDKQGKIAFSCVGYKESNMAELRKTLEQLTK